MKHTLLILFVFLNPVRLSAGAEWAVALPGWDYQFPGDHQSHPDFKTEWWYFTGNLDTENGKRIGFQLVFFRQGITPPDAELPGTSPFITRNISLAHFALTDVSTGRFYYGQKLNRGAFRNAGFGEGDRLAWIEDWECRWDGDGFVISASLPGGVSLDLQLTPAKAPIIHGKNGISQKSAGEGRASHYVTYPSLAAAGTLKMDGSQQVVTGQAWFDQEWATNQLDAHQTGWDWFSLQFDDDTQMMLFQIRTKEGGMDSFSHGTWIEADGSTRHISSDDFKLTPVAYWKSPQTGATYPIEWTIEVTALDAVFQITTPVRHQELVLEPISYWEGAVDVKGMQNGIARHGRGYLEMTGYAGEVVGMTSGRQ